MLSETVNELLQYLGLVLSGPYSVRNLSRSYAAKIVFVLLPLERSARRLLNVIGTYCIHTFVYYFN